MAVHSADGTRIAYDHEGEGPALVLVGGAFNDRDSTQALAGRLAGGFTVFRYDRRGRGQSPGWARSAITALSGRSLVRRLS